MRLFKTWPQAVVLHSTREVNDTGLSYRTVAGGAVVLNVRLMEEDGADDMSPTATFDHDGNLGRWLVSRGADGPLMGNFVPAFLRWSNKQEKARMIKSKIKCLLITFFDVKGLVHYEFVPEGQTINQHYYLDVLEAVRQKRPENDIGKIGSCIMTTHGHIRPSLYNSIWLKTELLYYPSHPILLTLLPTTFSLTLKLKKS
ncbi:hypothetical protein LAZ67_8003855 [Cordylochernes scorpioides]|uniref:Uncharacterized protein n=1 Tax=Cordylochernes scorpioides TaxID=51811 RepID=A0ABY6KUN7_9ARAC|nr:hypothetical protein LAZ67_8003855 [Cordylochernes scorpioides]